MAGEHHGDDDVMAAQNQPDFRTAFWDKVFPGSLPTGDVTVSVVDTTGFELESSFTTAYTCI
jgi:hypothetical protein